MPAKRKSTFAYTHVRTLANQGSGQRIAPKTIVFLERLVVQAAQSIAHLAARAAVHSARKTITEKDVKFAISTYKKPSRH